MFEDFQPSVITDSYTRRRYCGYTRWLNTLSGPDIQAAEDIMSNRDYNSRALARYFQSKGATFNDQVLNRHRNGHCCGQGR